MSLGIWSVFFPGLMSPDSLNQYKQAVESSYSDWHPPLMALVLHCVLAVGGSLSLVTLGQCLGGTFGIRALSEELSSLLTAGQMARSTRAWTSLLVLALLLLPVTPLAFFLMTLWKDTWALVLMLWLLAALLRIRHRGVSGGRLAAAVTLAVAFAMVRHNAVVILPFVGGLLLALHPPPRGLRALSLALAPVAAYALLTPLTDTLLQVKKSHLESVSMELDLVAICARSAEQCSQLPWFASRIRDPSLLARYRPGDVGFILWDWDQPAPVDPDIRNDYRRLRREYLTAVRLFPQTLARVKLEAFLPLLGIDETFAFFQEGIVDNPYGLSLNARFAFARARLGDLGHAVSATHWRWLSGVHGVWLAIGGGLLLAFAVRWRVHGREPEMVLTCLLVIPLAYYLSYLLATTAHDFRFLYPATVAVQVIALTLLGVRLRSIGGRAWHRPGS